MSNDKVKYNLYLFLLEMGHVIGNDQPMMICVKYDFMGFGSQSVNVRIWFCCVFVCGRLFGAASGRVQESLDGLQRSQGSTSGAGEYAQAEICL